MSDTDELPKKAAKGSPAWIMTFADLMSLLMCFFVLLLSFSEMDNKKFKQVAGSMEKAFGVQRLIKASELPRGTSIIMQEFSPGRPDPTPINEVRQSTVEDLQDLLKIEKEKVDSSSSDAKTIAEALLEEIRAGNVEVDAEQNKIVIRILEKGSFDSGSANLKIAFLPTLKKISKVLAVTPGQITVAGFTDNVPIQTDIYRSNWELSAIRAFAVINELLKNDRLLPKRFILTGYGANRPIAPNDTIENRSKNRRVEIIILQGPEYEVEDDKVMKIEDDADAELLKDRKELLENSEVVEPTFRPAVEITSDKDETDTGASENDLGVFEEDALYNYELGDVVAPLGGQNKKAPEGEKSNNTPEGEQNNKIQDGETPETPLNNPETQIDDIEQPQENQSQVTEEPDEITDLIEP